MAIGSSRGLRLPAGPPWKQKEGQKPRHKRRFVRLRPRGTTKVSRSQRTIGRSSPAFGRIQAKLVARSVDIASTWSNLGANRADLRPSPPQIRRIRDLSDSSWGRTELGQKSWGTLRATLCLASELEIVNLSRRAHAGGQEAGVKRQASLF